MLEQAKATSPAMMSWDDSTDSSSIIVLSSVSIFCTMTGMGGMWRVEQSMDWISRVAAILCFVCVCRCFMSVA